MTRMFSKDQGALSPGLAATLNPITLVESLLTMLRSVWIRPARVADGSVSLLAGVADRLARSRNARAFVQSGGVCTGWRATVERPQKLQRQHLGPSAAEAGGPVLGGLVSPWASDSVRCARAADCSSVGSFRSSTLTRSSVRFRGAAESA
jgi:hypothetical protein